MRLRTLGQRRLKQGRLVGGVQFLVVVLMKRGWWRQLALALVLPLVPQQVQGVELALVLVLVLLLVLVLVLPLVPLALALVQAIGNLKIPRDLRLDFGGFP